MTRLICCLLLCAATARADLATYIAKPDRSFAWKLDKTDTTKAATVYSIALTSQTWQKIEWKHDLVVILPAGVKPTATMLLWNTGGKPSARNVALQAQLAINIKAPVAFLYGIPAQPLFGDKKEDALIAETFVRYLDTKDADWPLLFPMVKSLVKAMDALQAFAKAEWKVEVKNFVVSGASKRGWTSWLTAASDPRVKAVMPVVIDTLHMQKQMPHQLKSFGTYSLMIKDYTERKLVPMPDSDDARRLWSWVDPWVYRARLKMPKMIVNGTNDPYWTQDALNLYWDDLEGPKYISYVPNAGHNLEETLADGSKSFDRAIGILSGFAAAMIHDRPMPKLTWKTVEGKGAAAFAVTSDPAPQAARLWTADAPTRDFRKANWTATELPAGRDIGAKVAKPKDGYRVGLVECEYEANGLTYRLTTQVRIVGE
jgi:PhoPQ-activated pathogenicity-related protein